MELPNILIILHYNLTLADADLTIWWWVVQPAASLSTLAILTLTASHIDFL